MSTVSAWNLMPTPPCRLHSHHALTHVWGLPQVDSSPSLEYALCLCTPRPSFVTLPLLEAPTLPSLPVQILPPTESSRGPRLLLTEDMPDLLPFPRPFLTDCTSRMAFVPFSFKVLVSGSEAPYPLGQDLCLSCPYSALIS